MYITEIKEISKSKSLISIDGEVAFALYKGDLRLYKIEQGKQISREIYDELISNVLVKRAKLRCMHLLKSRAYTETQLRTKLRASYYPSKIIEEALQYVKSFHYVDDKQYCEDYVSYNISKLSRQAIIHKLQEKGIDKALILSVYDEVLLQNADGNDVNGNASGCERRQIQEWLHKKSFDIENADNKEINRMVSFLVRKGYQYNDIRVVMRLYENND